VLKKLTLVLGALATMGIVAAASSAGDDKKAGFHTSTPAMLAPIEAGVTVKPIITVGDTLPGGYLFESIPDGIALKTRGQGRVDLWVNHETSTVPFPIPPTVPVAINDFTNAMVSELSLNQHSAGVLKGRYAIPDSANYQRFCSNFLAGSEHGFERDLLFTNEEATDFVFRTGVANPGPTLVVPPGTPGAEQAGVVVALDVKSGEFKSIYGMGRHNHENAVAVPGYGHPVVLSGDDTFSAPSSQLYLYTADSAAQVWADEGALWALRSDDPATNDYGDLSLGESVSGEFIPVPEDIAKGAQTGLENWSNQNNVFQFIRVEDIAYDRNDQNIVYFADTGEPRAVADPATGRLRRAAAGTQGPWPNGRIFRLVLDESDPTQVESLSILIDADTGGYGNVNVIHQPDNVETTENSLLIQEDPGSHNQGATTARIWRYELDSGDLDPVIRVDQSAQPSAALGAWESSGIVDASGAFGPGAFLVDVQAPTLVVNRADGPDFNGDGNPEWIYEREGGQLLLVTIPDA
jgi:Alkaline phosphatase PhoX